MTVSLVVAHAENRTIGRGGKLPWHLPADLQFFKRLTTNHTIVMGRKTYESIGRPLPNRRSIVITRDPGYRADGVDIAPSLEEALAMAAGDDDVFIIGGAEVFEQGIPLAERIYLTKIHAQVEGDVWFPPIDEGEWTVISREDHAADDRHAYAFTFITYQRKA